MHAPFTGTHNKEVTEAAGGIVARLHLSIRIARRSLAGVRSPDTGETGDYPAVYDLAEMLIQRLEWTRGRLETAAHHDEAGV